MAPAHELGHNLGLQHDRSNNPTNDPPAFPFGYGYRLCGGKGPVHTVMAYSCGESMPVPYFSSPALNLNGRPIRIKHAKGSKVSADSAQALTLAAWTVANYRVSGDLQGSPCPAGVKASTQGPRAIDLHWADVSRETGYKIYRMTEGHSNWILVATLASGSTRYTDSGLTSSTKYIYRVTAYNSGGESPPGQVASATTLSAQGDRSMAPPVPLLKPGEIRAGGVVLILSVNPGAAGQTYTIYQSMAGGAYMRMGTVVSGPMGSAQYRDTTAPSRGVLIYRATLSTPSGTSDMSTPVTIQVPCIQANIPQRPPTKS